MKAVRLANAEEARHRRPCFRYIVDLPIHEGVDPNREIRILDSFMGRSVTVTELLDRLPVDLRKLVDLS
uniref:Uncharacterized protein n=1 Tax=Leviviridae sp. TaxID=2027243 RepID=A0A514D5K2_9VIRU|nr:MAG: hypothetical protein H2RhizoLitter494206_000002 [Leviviridae sp.]